VIESGCPFYENKEKKRELFPVVHTQWIKEKTQTEAQKNGCHFKLLKTLFVFKQWGKVGFEKTAEFSRFFLALFFFFAQRPKSSERSESKWNKKKTKTFCMGALACFFASRWLQFLK
jgi:hypothetical protein